MHRYFTWNDLEDPVDADALEEVATAIHWACIDVSDVDRPVLQRWHALDSAFQVAGASEQIHSALDRSSNASRSMAGTGYRLEKILYAYAQAARTHGGEPYCPGGGDRPVSRGGETARGRSHLGEAPGRLVRAAGPVEAAGQ
ncbi:hypothetical protein GCM10025784_26190 [Citricoccus nitrophenolicus]